MSRPPIRVASIDVGSNALRFFAVEFKNRTDFDILSRERIPLRLGHDVFILGRMTEKTIDSAIKGLSTFYEDTKKLEIKKFRAVATSSLRESVNAAQLINRVRDEIGIELEKISASEEARLTHLSVINRMHLGAENWLIADVGGGSVEVLLANDEDIIWSESKRIGAIRLLKEFEAIAKDQKKSARLLDKYLNEFHFSDFIKKKRPAGFIATGGNIETIASLIEPYKKGIIRIKLKNLRNLIQKLVRLSFHERMIELGLKRDRADVIFPASLLYERLAVLAGVEDVIVPHAELCEGIVLDIVDGLY